MSVTSPTLIAFLPDEAVVAAVLPAVFEEPPQAARSAASGNSRASRFTPGILLTDDAGQVLWLDEDAARLRALVAADDLPPLEHVDQPSGARVPHPQAALQQ